VRLLSHVRFFATPCTVACQAPPSMGFSRQEYWSGLPFPSPGDLPNPGIKPRSPTLQADYLPSEPSGKPIIINKLYYFKSDYFETFLKLHFHFIYLKCNRGSQKNVIHYYLESLCKFLWTFRFFQLTIAGS